MYTERQII